MSDGVSVVIPTYNRADLLPRAIESVLNQTRAVKEILVVDDGSTDDTQQVIRRFESRGVCGIRKDNGGASSARNLGIERAGGDLIGLLDSDDEWAPSFLEKTLDLLEQHPNAALCFTDTSFARDGQIVEPSMNWGTMKKRFGSLLQIQPGWSGCLDARRFRRAQIQISLVPLSAVVIRKSVFDAVGLFDGRYDPAEDYEMWLRISRQFDFGYIDEPLGTIHAHGTNLTGQSRLQEVFRQKHRNILKTELAWETDGELRDLMAKKLYEHWEHEIGSRLAENDWVRLYRVLLDARKDGWRPTGSSPRRVWVAGCFGASAGLLVHRLLELMGI